MNEQEQMGYDAWMNAWIQLDALPTLSICPARWMPEGEARSSFLRDWQRAFKESVK